MTEDSLGLVLLQRGSFFDDRISITRSVVFVNQPSVLQLLLVDLYTITECRPEINKSHPRIRAALD